MDTLVQAPGAPQAPHSAENTPKSTPFGFTSTSVVLRCLLFNIDEQNKTMQTSLSVESNAFENDID